MKFQSKYLDFVKAKKQNPRTRIYNIYTKGNSRGIFFLGQIRWYAQWRQYGFYPEEGTVFEKTCLSDIANFCIDLNQKQKSKRNYGNDLGHHEFN